ncbi:DUF222 domain-containing protein [Nocardioides sp. GCM10027113]|uniref:HNH endonuclease signature motif containing protein n=1 Tax=unclassified Nocardioides TaxID=2615069 RepID=UPI003619A381
MAELHPVLDTVDALADLLKAVADVPVDLLATDEKREALRGVSQAAAQLESLRLRLVATSADVADEDGCRDVAAWLSSCLRSDRSGDRRDARLAASLDRWQVLAVALAQGSVNVDQAHVIARALDELPADVGLDVCQRAEAHLVGEAATFGPRELRTLGRRILDVVAPELGEDHERRALEREERRARRTTSLTSHRNGDGTTSFRIKVPDAVAHRLETYLEAFTSPRQGADDAATAERLPHDQRAGQAFAAFLEAVDPARLPLHGGDATTVVITIDLAALRDDLGGAALGSGDTISAGEARRLACTARVLPMVLGGESEVLDLGRSRRLFSPAQRRAMAVRDRACRAQGCDIPAPWCEAHHHRQPWAHGGRTDLAEGRLLCSFHHHRAHDERYLHTELPNGDIRFHRRR